MLGGQDGVLRGRVWYPICSGSEVSNFEYPISESLEVELELLKVESECLEVESECLEVESECGSGIRR